ncbi:MAG TPA: hypothetical protein VHI13_19710 [Candidatus Kapabacteria bacterium]|nr:hypothetical protein [Candidatus Kapabacteria bacterium]
MKRYSAGPRPGGPAVPWMRGGVLIAALLLLCAASAHACPNCGIDAVAAQKGGAETARGFVYGTIALAGAPVAVIASLVTIIVRAVRRRDGSGIGD